MYRNIIEFRNKLRWTATDQCSKIFMFTNYIVTETFKIQSLKAEGPKKIM